MKGSAIFIIAAMPIALGAEIPEKYRNVSTKVRDVATHETLTAKLAKARKEDPIQKIGPPKGEFREDPAKQMAKRDLIAESTVVAYRGFLTLVPKESVLHIPENLEDRIGVQSGAKIQTFQDFYEKNRGWIRTIEVTRDQARGHKPLPETLRKAFESSTSLVVATHKGGPISVLPLKDPEEIPSPSEARPKTYR